MKFEKVAEGEGVEVHEGLDPELDLAAVAKAVGYPNPTDVLAVTAAEGAVRVRLRTPVPVPCRNCTRVIPSTTYAFCPSCGVPVSEEDA